MLFQRFSRSSTFCSLLLLSFSFFLIHYDFASATFSDQHQKQHFPLIINTSFSGYVLLNETTQSNMFYWLFPAQLAPWDSAPLILWLEGGPGIPGTFQVFGGMGPYRANSSSTVTANEFTWNLNYSLLFVDNPVGVGFSYVEEGDGIPQTADEVARDLYIFLLQFYTVYPQYLQVDLYVFGESYGGKYVPWLTNYILNQQQIPSPKVLLPLRGIGIGDGLVDPMLQASYWVEFGIMNGLLDSSEAKYWNEQIDSISVLIQEDLLLNASIEYLETMLSKLATAAGYVNPYDIRRYDYPQDMYIGESIVNNTQFEQLLHVYPHIMPTYANLSIGIASSVVQPSAPLFPRIFSESSLRVFIYNGQNDWLIPARSLDAWICALGWSGAAAYNETARSVFQYDQSTAAYVKQYGTLTTAVVVGAGHFANWDKPEVMQSLVSQWIDKREYFQEK